MFNSDLRLREVLGLTPTAGREALMALRGEAGVPPSRFGPSSMRIFTPRLAAKTWLGARALGRKVPIVNLVNRTPTPVTDGWSVRVTQVRDFRGGGLTYNSHNGTDFAVPPGTRVVAAAPGRVVAVRSEYNRGGLKLYVDHGGGLLTTYNHLARSLVSLGDVVDRGEPLALSGYSGIDALASFLAVAPHLHFNVMLGGALVDPFSAPGEISLWRGGRNMPLPERGSSDAFAPTAFSPDAVEEAAAALTDPTRRAVLAGVADPVDRAWWLAVEAVTYPTRFARPDIGRVLFGDVARQPCLSLPFSGDDFDEAAFADELRLGAAVARA